MSKIYYVGDWAVELSPIYAESPFNDDVKGVEVFNYGKWLTEALHSSGKHQVKSVFNWGCNFVYWDHYNDFWLKCLELMF